MSEKVFLINPRRRTAKGRFTRARKTSRRKARRNPGELMFVNPSRRRRTRKHSTRKSFRRSYRRNPGTGGLPSGIKDLLPLAAVAAAGAVTVRTANALILKQRDTGIMGYAGMAGISTAALLIGTKVRPLRKWAVAFALGGYVATADRVIREVVMPRVMPNLPLSGLGDFDPSVYGVGDPMLPESIEGSVGEYDPTMVI